MKIINKILTEQIEKVLMEKDYNNSYKDYEQQKKRQSKDVSTDDENSIRHDATQPIINVAALAKKVYPDHTPEGAQSQLRKKLKGIKNDNGSEYHIKGDEAKTIRKEISKL